MAVENMLMEMSSHGCESKGMSDDGDFAPIGKTPSHRHIGSGSWLDFLGLEVSSHDVCGDYIMAGICC